MDKFEEAWDFYAPLSGLTPMDDFSLADHMYAYYSALSGRTPILSNTLDDHKMGYFSIQTPTAPAYFSRTDRENFFYNSGAQAFVVVSQVMAQSGD